MPKIINCELSSDIDELYLYVISDVHIGSPQCDIKKFKKLIAEIENTEHSIVILNGDLIDNAITNSKSNVYSQTMPPSEQLRYVAELLQPIKDKIVVIHQGNHCSRTSKQVGFDLSEALAVELVGRAKAEEIYSSNPYLLFVEFGRNQGRDCRKTIYSIYGRHGMASGTTIGSKVNQLHKTGEMIPNSDIVIHSHTHTPILYKDTVTNIDYRNRKVNIKNRLFVNSASFLGAGSYGESMALKPTAIEFPKIILKGDHREVIGVL